MKSSPPLTETESYQRLVGLMHKHGGGCSETEAQEAARNLMGFARTVLAIRKRMNENADHGKCH